MKVSTKGRYALRVMIELGMNQEQECVSLSDIAKHQQISLKYLEQIMRMLSKAGFVVSERGVHGGYRLAKDTSAYTVGDILRVMEGSLAPITCLEENAVPCKRKEECTSLSFWQGLYACINQYVDSYTLKDLIIQNALICKEIK